LPKFFVDKSKIVNNIINIDGENANHIVNVLRTKIYDKIIVCDNNGMDYECIVKDIDKKNVIVQVVNKCKNQNEPNIKITLYQGLPKYDKMELVIQKCVEIGIDKIVPVKTEHTVVKLENKEDKKILRWNKISESAAKQCGRGKIPIVENIINFDDAILRAKENDSILIPYEYEKNNKMKDFVKNFNGKSIAVFIGPEGGFSEREIKFAVDNGANSVTLGNRILRTETAGLVTSVILFYEMER